MRAHIGVQQLLTGLITEHADHSVVHIKELAVRRSEEQAFLNIVEEFAVPPLRFTAVGNVFQHVGFHGQYTNTIGIGIRFATPVGPIRFDIGHNLNAPPGIKSTQYFVTIGQAF